MNTFCQEVSLTYFKPQIHQYTEHNARLKLVEHQIKMVDKQAHENHKT